MTYGKGRHPARLNMGDCFTYASARVAHLPVLYVGEDCARSRESRGEARSASGTRSCATRGSGVF
jgi:hypothetical protein